MRNYHNCYNCGYLKEELLENRITRYYCNEKDCYVIPYDPECNYDEYETD